MEKRVGIQNPAEKRLYYSLLHSDKISSTSLFSFLSPLPENPSYEFERATLTNAEIEKSVES
jgi:hypothetical protein